MIHAKTCPQCGQAFEHDTFTSPRRDYCSDQCQRRAAHERKRARGGDPRRCPMCGEIKPGSDYSSGTFSYCKPCAASRERDRRQQGLTTEYRAWYSRMDTLRRYGLTFAQFDDMVAAQKNKCAICGTDKPGGSGKWHVDHDHTCCSTRKASCGKCLRGLLCSRCNIGLGNFGDDPTVLDRAAEYIRRYQMSRASGLPMP